MNRYRLNRKVAMSFEEMISRIDVPLALIYGKEDPWVMPLWGHRIKRQRPETLYYQVWMKYALPLIARLQVQQIKSKT